MLNFAKSILIFVFWSWRWSVEINCFARFYEVNHDSSSSRTYDSHKIYTTKKDDFNINLIENLHFIHACSRFSVHSTHFLNQSIHLVHYIFSFRQLLLIYWDRTRHEWESQIMKVRELEFILWKECVNEKINIVHLFDHNEFWSFLTWNYE